MLKELDEKRQALKEIEDAIPDINQEIMKMDMLKSYVSQTTHANLLLEKK